MQRQLQDQRSSRGGRSVYEVQQHEEPCQTERGNNYRSFDLVNISYCNFDSVKLVIFTKLEASTSQSRAHLKYIIYTRSNDNLVPYNVFRILFHKSTLAALRATKNYSVILKYINTQVLNS